MKKVLTGIAATALTVSLCAATAFAAGPWCGHHAAWGGYGSCAYVDANWDGICDSCGAYRQYHHMAGTGCGGYYFVDADGDGICDNYGTGLGLGRGCGHGHGSRCGRGW